MFYTYLWLREDGTPYYVGKGKGNRAFDRKNHIQKPPSDTSRILVQDFTSEADAFKAEIFLIDYYGRKDLGTGCLRNRTEGGVGGKTPITPLGRERIRKFMSERVVSTNTKNILRKRATERFNSIGHGPRKDKVTSEHTKQLMRKAKTGKKMATGFGDKIRSIRLGTKSSEETHKKISESIKKWWTEKKFSKAAAAAVGK